MLRAGASLRDVAEPTPAQWLAALDAAVTAICELGGAKPGDRTMVDALRPAVEAWRDAIARGEIGFDAAADAAQAGAEATAQMFPALGRASYLGERAVGVPDGGAVAVAIWMRALADSL
jgi:dihydroxyacetone kinase